MLRSVEGRLQLLGSIMKLARRGFLHLVAGATAVPITITLRVASALDYPTRPVKIITPFGAGGPTDVYTRAIADEVPAVMWLEFCAAESPDN